MTKSLLKWTGAARATLKINGEVVLDARDRKLSGVRSQPVALRSGLNRFELDYQSPREWRR